MRYLSAVEGPRASSSFALRTFQLGARHSLVRLLPAKITACAHSDHPLSPFFHGLLPNLREIDSF